MEMTPPLDVRVDHLALLVRMRLRLGQGSEAMALLRSAMTYFDAAGAFAASGRAFADAEEIARSEHLPEELAELWESRATSLSDAGRHEEALEILARTEGLCAEWGLDLPRSLRLNVANLNVRLGRYDAALDAFKALNPSELSGTERFTALTNTAICHLRLDDPTSAFWASEDALRLLHEGCDCSLTDYIELLFVKAAIYSIEGSEDWRESIGALVGALDNLLLKAERLHYRRAVRERYARRLAKLLRGLPPSGPSANILGALLWQAGNSTTDWLSLLEWAEDVRKDGVSEAADRLTTCIDKVAASGAPMLYGFREKYDDPFEPSALDGALDSGTDQFRRAWHDLFTSVQEVKHYNAGAGPYGSVLIQELSDHYLTSLRSGTSYLFSIAYSQGYCLFVLSGETYSRVDLPEEPFKSVWASLDLSRHKQSDSALHEAVEVGATSLFNSLGKQIEDAARRSNRLVVFPDRLSESLPFLGAMLKSDAIRAKMLDGGFSTATAIATFPTMMTGTVAVAEAFVLIDPPASLKLGVEEADMITRCFPEAVMDRRSTSVSSDVTIATTDADLIHIAAHGSAVTVFNDPWLAGFLEADGFWLGRFQAGAHRLRHRLVFLNICHGGVTGSRNVFETFVSREALGFLPLALLNRRSSAIAPAWAVPSISAYVFAKLFYDELALGMVPERALAVAAARMHGMSGDEAAAVARDLSDASVAERYATTFQQVEYPFRSTWNCGAYRCFLNG